MPSEDFTSLPCIKSLAVDAFMDKWLITNAVVQLQSLVIFDLLPIKNTGSKEEKENMLNNAVQSLYCKESYGNLFLQTWHCEGTCITG